MNPKKGMGEFPVLADTPTSALLNINNIAMWVNDNGRLEHNEGSQSAGVTFPRGASTLVYESGLLWGGYVNDGRTPALRVGGQARVAGTTPGRINESRLPENRYVSGVRVYRIRRDWKTADLRQDASETFGISIFDVTGTELEELRTRYANDWLRWPWQKGAPYYERNGIPGYQPDTSETPGRDEPGLLNADQVIWLTCNDLLNSTLLAGSTQIGIEHQITCWAFASSGALGNVIFQQHKLIYKGTPYTPPTARIDSMYIAKWSDVDVGTSIDDYLGCKPGNNFAYAYNSSELDYEYNKYQLTPPVIGYDLLQGPRIPSPGGTATWNHATIPGYVNLPMSAFVALADSELRDQPDLRTYTGTQQWWNALRGFQPKPTSPPQCFINPFTDACTNFPFDGDPMNYTGWIDGRVTQRGDRRMLMSTGPFQMALGDTQEVIFALIAAQGANKIERLNRLDSIDFSVQDLYERHFQQGDTIPSPILRIVELDKNLILDWEHDEERMNMIENWSAYGYKFEKYTIYQYKSSSLSSESVEFPAYDPTAPRLLHISTDYLRQKPLVNGQKYYYALTATMVRTLNTGAQFRVETPRIIKTAVPHSANPGVMYPYEYGDTVTNLKHVVGINDAPIKVQVVEPTKLTGDTLKVGFTWNNRTGEEKPKWNLMKIKTENNITTTDTLLDYVFTDGPARHVISQGIDVSVGMPLFGLKGVFQTEVNGQPTNDRVFNVPNPGGNYMFLARDASQLDFLSGSSAVDKDIEFRFGEDSSWALMRRSSPNTSTWVRVPFSVWQMDRDESSRNGRRLFPVITQQGQDSVWRTRVLLDRGFNGKPLHEFYPVSVVADTYCITIINKCVGTYLEDINNPDFPLVRGFLFNTTASNEKALGLFEVYIADLDEDGAPAPSGTVVRFKRYKDISNGDETLILPEGIRYHDQQALKYELSRVNVFPNPYYGINRAETNISERFVTFNHLPYKATIRIFNLSGVMVKTILKDDETQFATWNLNNEHNLPVASGMYIVQIEMSDEYGGHLGTKDLKLMIVQGERFK